MQVTQIVIKQERTMNKMPRILIRGGGEMASGVAYRLFICHMRPVILELSEPRMIRRTVCFGEAVYKGGITIEGVAGRLTSFSEKPEGDYIPVIIDAEGKSIGQFKPHILIDARMMKTATDTAITQAPLVIGLGPGFLAGRDVHRVIETMRGHTIGKVYSHGEALTYTGIPGEIEGRASKRVLRAPHSGIFTSHVEIGAFVQEGSIVASIDRTSLRAPFSGTVRGLFKKGINVPEGEKVGDIDPRREVDVFSISDKARAIGGGVIEAIFSFFPWCMDVESPVNADRHSC